MLRLNDLLLSQRAQFDALAAVWLQANATAFGIARDGRDLMSWTREHKPRAQRVRATISPADESVGELWLEGLAEVNCRTRLEMDAAMIARWLQLETELDVMTGDLIEAQDQLLALYDLNRAMRKFFSLDALLAALVNEAARLMKCDNAFVMIETAEGQRYWAQVMPELLSKKQVTGLYDRVMRDAKPLVAAAKELSCLDLSNAQHVMCVPVLLQDKVGGVLGWLDKTAEAFNSPDLKLAQAIAEQAGADIENVILYNESLAQARMKTELDLARNIQSRLVPQTVPDIPGLDLCARMLPALQVGGDFYDLILSPGRPFCFALGDVSGKGMAAALVMAIVRTSLRTKARFMPNATPADMLVRLTEELYDDLTELSMFATTFVAQFDTALSQLIYANVGHAPVIFMPHDGEPQLLEADSAPLGVLPMSLAENMVRAFAPNDLLVVATDGFTEARNADGEMFGIPRLMELIRSMATRSAREISDALFEMIGQYSQGKVDDDQTLVVVKRVAQ